MKACAMLSLRSSASAPWLKLEARLSGPTLHVRGGLRATMKSLLLGGKRGGDG